MEIDDIYLGDCRQLIKGLNDNSVDLILSDIPYGISSDDWDVLHNNTNSALLGASPSQIQAGKIFQRNIFCCGKFYRNLQADRLYS